LPALLCAGLASACGTKASLGSSGGPALLHAKPESGGAVVAAPAEAIPVPPEDGPKLAPTAMVVPILAAPSRGSQAIGYLRLGSKVSRSKEPVGREGCAEGWYAVRPAGFVCANDGATIKLDHPLVRAVNVEPNRARPMPYNYAFVRAIAPNYLRVPTKDEQFKYEARLERHLRSWTKLARKWDELDVGANDVPLDPQGLAASDIPDHAVPLDVSHRFGGDGDDAVPWWLSGGRQIPNVSSFKAPTYAVMANRIKRHAGVALVGSFVAGPEAQSRRFAVTTDVRLIPADKLKADSGSPFHGADLHGVGLPVAFVYADDAKQWDASGAGLTEGESLPRREMLPLTGRVRMWQKTRFVETRSGHWVKSEEVRTAPKQTDLPWYAKGTTKWVDVSILSQTLVLWVGSTPVYATLVSTGKDGLGDPKTTHSTPTGLFRIYQKHVTTTMDSDMADHEFELRDVPWVMYFSSGYALHGAYWHDDFGKARSHGCVNLSPIDARFVFFWADPPVPDHWHAAYTGGTFGNGTMVNIHP
jgi:hypothetical protein